MAKTARQDCPHPVYTEREQGLPVEFQEAALDWYRTIYPPLATVIQRGRLADTFPDRTVADLYASWHCITGNSAADAITVLK